MIVNPSRAATNDLLAGLRAGRWRPAAWGRFLVRAADRSVRQARARPRALAEVTLLHAALAMLAGRRRGWTAASWALAATHLGMLGDRRSLGTANMITLLRANLPPAGGPGPWPAVIALASDLADGRIARHTAAVTAFGTYADSLADAAFWTWFALRHEPSRSVRTAAVAAWAAPVAGVTAASIARGRMTDPPRPAVLRPAAAMQAILAVRAITRHLSLSEPAQPRRGGSCRRCGGRCPEPGDGPAGMRPVPGGRTAPARPCPPSVVSAR